MRYLALVAVLGLALAPQVQAAGLYPFPPVPEPTPETMPLPPVSYQAQIWHPGYYDFDGQAYHWMPGSWMVRTPEMTGQWLPGHWEQVRAGYHVRYTWVPGHWV